MKRTIYIYGFWERLDKVVENSGLTQNEISERMGFPRSYITHVRNDGNMPNSGTLAKFCAVTGASADYLLGLRREA